MASPAQKRKKAAKASKIIAIFIVAGFAFMFVAAMTNDKNPIMMLFNKDKYDLGRARDEAFIYFEAKNYEKAVPSLEKLIKLDPEKALYHSMLGSSYARIGEPMKAISEFEETVRLDPEQHSAYGTMASIYLAYGKDAADKFNTELAQDFFNKATKQIEMALLKSPNNNDYKNIQKMIIASEDELNEN